MVQIWDYKHCLKVLSLGNYTFATSCTVLGTTTENNFPKCSSQQLSLHLSPHPCTEMPSLRLRFHNPEEVKVAVRSPATTEGVAILSSWFLPGSSNADMLTTDEENLTDGRFHHIALQHHLADKRMAHPIHHVSQECFFINPSLVSDFLSHDCCNKSIIRTSWTIFINAGW